MLLNLHTFNELISVCNEISTLTVSHVRVISHHYVRHYSDILSLG